LTVAIALCAVGAQAQVLNDPNIRVPSSSRPQPAGFMRTHYYQLIGPWRGRSGQNNPVLALHGPALMAPPPGYGPSDIRAAYNIPTSAQGGDAIAVVDAYDLPTNLNDFNVFANEFGLPAETSTNPTASTNKVFQVVYSGGQQPSADPDWGVEISLDMEWAHSMAPKAKIYLVEAPSSSGQDLYNAIQVAAGLPGVKEISMSWGSGEFQGENTLDSYFQASGIVFFASAGDNGGQQEYPSESPNVVGVGGTSLYMNGNTVTSEVAWGGSGGGPSSQEARPAFQNIVQSIVGGARGAPDVSLVADPNTGVAVYDSTPDQGYSGWFVVGGTSLSSPATAGITNVRARYSANSTAELNRIYANLGSPFYRDITQGTAGSFSAMAGWDFITGVGSSLGLWPTLSKITLSSSTVTGGQSVTLTATIPTTYSAPLKVTVTSAQTNTVAGSYTITIPAGKSSGSVSIATKAFVSANSRTVTLTADLDGSDQSATLTVNPTSKHLTVNSASVSPASVTGGATTILKVGFAAASDSTDTITVTSSNTTYVASVGSVNVPAGSTSINVSVPTKLFSTGSKQTITLTAADNGTSKTATLTVLPFAVSKLAVSHTDLGEGASQTFTVTMSAAAPSTQTIAVASSDTANLPSFTVSVATGSLTGTATVVTKKTYLAATTAIKATTSVGPAVSTSFNLHPLVTSFTVSPASIKGGTSTTGTVTFYAALGTAGTVTLPAVSGITYPSSPPSYSASATSVSFTIGAKTVASNTTYTLTAKVAGYTRTCTLTVTH
jgi:subtilase family serine protease